MFKIPIQLVLRKPSYKPLNLDLDRQTNKQTAKQAPGLKNSFDIYLKMRQKYPMGATVGVVANFFC